MPIDTCRTSAVGINESPLISRLQSADPTAMEELYMLYGRRAHTAIVRIVQDGGIAEDLVQETFLSVWRGANSFDSQRGLFGSWLLTVARNQALDYLRGSRKRSFCKSNCMGEIGDREDPRLLAEIERSVTATLTREPLQRAIRKLGDMQRAVVELTYFEGCTQAEISTKLARPIGTIKTWHLKALKKLKSELATAGVKANCQARLTCHKRGLARVL